MLLPCGPEAVAEAEPSTAAEAVALKLDRQALALALEEALPWPPPAAELLEALAAAEQERLPQPAVAVPLRRSDAEADVLTQAVPTRPLALAVPEAPLLLAEATGRAEEDLLLLLLGEAEPEFPPSSCTPPLAEALMLRWEEPESRAGDPLLQLLLLPDALEEPAAAAPALAGPALVLPPPTPLLAEAELLLL